MEIVGYNWKQAAKATAAAKKYNSGTANQKIKPTAVKDVSAQSKSKTTVSGTPIAEKQRYTDVTQEWRDNTTPNNHVDEHNIVHAQQKTVENVEKSAIMENRNGKGGADVHTVGRIDIEKYRCITDDITTDEVIITQERIQHIEDRRGAEFLKKYQQYFPLILSEPDYIFADDRPNTAIVCKVFEDGGETTNLVLRLAVKEDDPTYKNAILTAIRENRKRFAQRLRNNVPLYKKD